MPRNIFLCTLVASLSIAFALSSTDLYTIPIIAWSPIPSFFPSTSTLTTVNPHAFDLTLSSFFDASSGHLELVVLFVEDSLRTDEVSKFTGAYEEQPSGGDLKHVKSMVEAASSSYIAPYASSGDEQSLVYSAISNIVALKSINTVVASYENSNLFVPDAEQVDPLDLEDFLSSASILTNGKPDLLVVAFPPGRLHDSEVQAIIATVAARTSQYVAIYTANSASSFSSTTDNADLVAEKHHNERYYFDTPLAPVSNCTANNTVIVQTFFIGAMIEVYFIVAILLAIMFTGLCSMWELQTPERFDAPKAGGKMVM